MSPSAGSAPLELRVATLNLRNLADRWDERLPLLLADFAALQPDLIGLQNQNVSEHFANDAPAISR